MIANLLGLDRWVHDLPEDLRQSVGEGALMKLALDAAQKVATQRRWLSDPEEAQPDPQMMLALLTYCYAAGIYGSQDIEWACHNDPLVRSICPNIRPDWPAIWHFRNANRSWIEECLARVYVAASVAAPAETSREPAHISAFRGDATPDNIGFARQKVRHAARTDAAMFD